MTTPLDNANLTPRERRLVEAREPTEFERSLSTRELASSRAIEDDLSRGRISRQEAGRRLRRELGSKAESLASDNRLDISEATRIGAPTPLIESLGASSQQIDRATSINQAQVRIDNREPLDFLKSGGEPEDLLDAGYSEELVSDLEAIAPFADSEGRINVAAALESGDVPRSTLTRLFSEEAVSQATTRLEAQQALGNQSPLQFLQSGGNPDSLLAAGFNSEDVADLELVAKFADSEGRVNIQAALEADIPSETLERLFSVESVQSATTVLEARRELGDLSPSQFIQQGGNPDTLRELGMDSAIVDALSQLRPHLDSEGRINATAAREAGIPDSTLTTVGVDVSSIPAPTAPRFAPDAPPETVRWVKSVWEQAFREVVNHVGTSPRLSLPEAIAEQRRLAQARVGDLRREIQEQRGLNRQAIETRLQQFRRNKEEWESRKRSNTDLPDRYYFQGATGLEAATNFYRQERPEFGDEWAREQAEGLFDTLRQQEQQFDRDIQSTDANLRAYDIATGPVMREFQEQSDYAIERMDQLVKSARGGRVEPLAPPPTPGESRPFFAVVDVSTGQVVGHTQNPKELEAQGFETRPISPAVSAPDVTEDIIADLEDGLDPLELEDEYGELAVDDAIAELESEELDALEPEELESADLATPSPLESEADEEFASESELPEEGLSEGELMAIDLLGGDASELEDEDDLTFSEDAPHVDVVERLKDTRAIAARRKELESTEELSKADDVLARLAERGLMAQGGVSVPAALRAGFSPSELEAIGISREAQAGAVKDALNLAIAGATAPPLAAPSATPVAQPRRVPAPGKTLPVSPAIMARFSEAEQRADMIVQQAIMTGGGSPTPQDASWSRQYMLLKEIKEEVEQGNLSNEQGIALSNMVTDDITAEDWDLAKLSLAMHLSVTPAAPVGTALTWDNDKGWQRALNLSTDLIGILPVIGSTSGMVRSGTKFPRIVGTLVTAELLGNATAITDPIRAGRGLLEPLQIANLKRVPINILEKRTSTIRIPAEPRIPPSPGRIDVPTETLSKVAPETIKLQSNRLELKAIRGESAEGPIGAVGKVQLSGTGLQSTTGAAAVHTTPDLRWLLMGAKVEPGAEGGLFVSHSLHSRFAGSSAFGKTAATAPPDLRIAAEFGSRVDRPMPGAAIIRDPEVLAALRGAEQGGLGSGAPKVFKGQAELEQVIPAGVDIPPVSQLLKTTDAAGDTLWIAVVGKPFTGTELAKLKLVGTAKNISSIFAKPGRFLRTAADEGAIGRRAGKIRRANESIPSSTTAKAKKADSLFDAAEVAARKGNQAEAGRLLSRANRLADDVRVDLSIARARGLSNMIRAPQRIIATYVGDQDIQAGLREISTTPKRGDVRVDSPLLRDRVARAGGGFTRVRVDAIPPEALQRIGAADARVARAGTDGLRGAARISARDGLEPTIPRSTTPARTRLPAPASPVTPRRDQPGSPIAPRVDRPESPIPGIPGRPFDRPPTRPPARPPISPPISPPTRLPGLPPAPPTGLPPAPPTGLPPAPPTGLPRISPTPPKPPTRTRPPEPPPTPVRIQVPDIPDRAREVHQKARREGLHPIIVGVNKGAWDLVVDLRTGRVSHPKDLPEIPEIGGKESFRVLEYGDEPTMPRKVRVGFEEVALRVRGPNVEYRFLPERIGRLGGARIAKRRRKL